MRNQYGFTTMELLMAIFTLVVFIAIVFVIVSVASWLFSGEVAQDIGNFLGEVQNNMNQGTRQ